MKKVVNLQHTMQFAQRIGIQSPAIIQAPMAGGITTPELVAAVSNAGGLGSFATGYLTTQDVLAGIKAIKNKTSRPFSVNVFVPPDHVTQDENIILDYQRRINVYRHELGLPINHATTIDLPQDNLSNIIDVLLAEDVRVVSFAFGLLPKKYMDALKSRGVYLMGTATSLDEAILLENAGVNAVVAQGSEAGGHRGGFSKFFSTPMMSITTLVPSIAQKIHIPVIAAGGIMNARGVMSAIMLGASAVQMGTAFLAVLESGANAVYKAALLEAKNAGCDVTQITSSYSGKPARGIKTRFMQEIGNEKIPDYPIPHYLTQPIRKEAAKQNKKDFMSLWCGRGIAEMEFNLMAGQLLKKIREEVEIILSESQDKKIILLPITERSTK